MCSDFSPVLFSQVELRRNISGLCFPSALDDTGKAEVNERVRVSCTKIARNFSYFDKNSERNTLSSLSELKLIDSAIMKNDYTGYLLGDNNNCVIAINEEDHIKITIRQKGLSVQDVYKQAKEIEKILAEDFSFAFSERRGYLTESLKNTGNACIFSVIIHLPAMGAKRMIAAQQEALSLFQSELVPFFKEGKTDYGNVYILRSKANLGESTQKTASKIYRSACDLAASEKYQREIFSLNASLVQLDAIYRAYGILKNARLISYEEALKLLSAVILASESGIIENISTKALTELMFKLSPAAIYEMYKDNSYFDRAQISYARAALIRNSLS